MLRFLKHFKTTEHVICPNCLTEQEVTGSALSVFCKNCKNRIDIETQKQKVPIKIPAQNWKPKTKTITCPYCHSLQEVLATAISSFCKNCNQRISIKEDSQAEFGETISVNSQKEINCPHCGTPQKVPSTALSSFCPDCGNRINLQNYEIKGRFRGDLDTKGLIYITNEGIVEGNINTGSVIVAGRFKGEIVAEEKIQIKSTAKLYGKIRAPVFSADTGAVFVGHLHIGK